MDISKQFSLTDFLAYFFPGAFATTGLYLLVQLTPAKSIATISSLDVATGLLFLILSYLIGVISSGFSWGIVNQIEKLTKYKNPDTFLPANLFPDEISRAFREVFGKKEVDFLWTNNHYRLCRSLVVHKMPALAQRISRQDDMALLRRNLIFPLLIWTTVGVSWGIWGIYNSSQNWSIALIAGSFIVSILVIRILIQRMHNSYNAETRETLLGFLAGYKVGLFKAQKES